ncbi:ABC transporter ATP-binding protein [Lacibacterium aquatile]|uniref:ABC transporter ATP-binding protein n=1 Tax=Lacibacterium aquatile TaxID=1168082 RepID=A0ABW5DRR1_9PROT
MTNISVRDMTIAFGARRVLDTLSLEVKAGEFLVLLGPSGCGKSTLLHTIAGLMDVTEGEIWIGDKNVTWEEPSDRGLAMVFQSYALYPRMSVRQNLSFGLKVAGLPKDEINRRVDAAAELLKLTELMERLPAALSGGQRQRVAIGRALVRQVGVFLFDEPLSNLDAQLRTDLRVELKRLHARLKSTMVYVTHDQVEAMTLADRIAIMKDGIIQQIGTPYEVYRQPVNRFVATFIGAAKMNLLKGHLVVANNKTTFVREGYSIDLAGYEFATPPQDRQEVELGIRPEHLGQGEIPLSVEIVEPMGADTLVWASANGVTFAIRLDGEREIRPGDTLPISIPVTHVSLFDAATGRRI